MAELTAALHGVRKSAQHTGKIRPSRVTERFPDYAGDHTAEARERPFAIGSEAVPTNGIAGVRTAPDCADMFRAYNGVRGYCAFDGGVGDTADVNCYALVLSDPLNDVLATAVWALVGQKTGIGHLEEFECNAAAGRPVRFQVVNATDAGDIYFAPK